MSRPLAVPLAPHGPAGALDVGLAACGACPVLWLRFAAAGGLPAALLADAAGRACGHGWVVGALAVLFVTAPLGLRIAATAVRGTFGEDDAANGGAADLPRLRTKRERTREALLSGLCVLLAALYLAPRWFDLPTAFGAWLADPAARFTVAATLAAAWGLRSWSDLSRRAPLPPRSGRLLAGRIGVRALLGWPLYLFFIPDWTPLAWICLVMWTPIAVGIAGKFAFRSERRALRAISARLHDEHADGLLKTYVMGLAGRANLLGALSAGLWLIGMLTADLVGSALLNWRPALGAALGAGSSGGGNFWAALADDPTAAALAALGGATAYVAVRVGWFATLVDLRVRRDCWDVQQAVIRERNRLADEERRAAPPVTPAPRRTAARRTAPRSAGVAAAFLLTFAPHATAFAQSPAPADPAEVSARAEAVLGRDEFRPLRDFGERGDGLFPPLGGGSPLSRREGEGGGAGDGAGPGSGGGAGRSSNRTPSGGSGAGGGSSRGSSGSGSPGVGAAVGALGQIVSTIALVAAGAALAAVLLLLIGAVVRGVMERESAPATPAAPGVGRGVPSEDGAPAARRPPDERLAAARTAAADGRYGEAVALLLNGLTDRVELAGLIRPRRGLTAREYLRAARPDPALHPALATVVKVYEPLGYGRRPGQLEQYAEAEAAYLAGVSTRAAHDPAPTRTQTRTRTRGDA